MPKLSKFVVVALGLLIGLPAFAQTESYAGLTHLNKILGNTPGMTFLPTPGGTGQALGDVDLKPSGLKVPLGIKAPLPAGRMAGMALGCMGGGVIGAVACAAGVAGIAKELKDHGAFGRCPDGSTDLFCKTPVPAPSDYPYDPNQGGWIGSGSNPLCSSYACTLQQAIDSVLIYCNPYRHVTRLVPFQNGSTSSVAVYCTYSSTGPEVRASDVMRQTAPNPVSAPEPVPATDQEVFDELNRIAAADYAANQRILQEMQKDIERNPAAWPPETRAVRPGDAIVVDAPPVTSPAKTTKVETIPNADGTTSTRTTSETTKVTPTTSGTTAGDTKITFPTSTTSTVTTVNNSTNVTTTSTTVVNNPIAQPEVKPLEIPNDYNKEATQIKIESHLNTDSVTTTPADQEARTKTTVDAANQSLADKFSALPTELTSDKANWFSWVWTPPIGVCAPYTGTVHGFAIALDICPTVANIREALGFIFALFAAWNIYGLIFRGES